MAGDRAALLGVLNEMSDLYFGYDLEALNVEDLEGSEFVQLVVGCCEALGIPEPRDFSGVPTDSDGLIGYFLERWDGSTVREV